MSDRTILVEGDGGRRILRTPEELAEHDRKDYCTQNGGDCSTCSLVNYGRDCRNIPIRRREGGAA